MKILFVNHSLPPYSQGGSELCTAALARAFAARHTVCVFAGGQLSARGYHVRWQPGPEYVTCWLDLDVGRSQTLKGAYENAAVDAKFAEVLEIVQPDIVHVHGVWGLSNNLPLVARRFGCAVVFTLHDFWLMCPRGQRLRPSDLSRCEAIEFSRCAECLAPWVAPSRVLPIARLRALLGVRRPTFAIGLKKALARAFRPIQFESQPQLRAVHQYHQKSLEVLEAVDLFIAPSRFLRHQFIAYGIPATKIIYSDNGIDTSTLAPGANKTISEQIRFGFIGSWMPSKGLHVLIEAFQGLTKDAKLTISGGPPAGDPGIYAKEVIARANGVTVSGRFDSEQIGTRFRDIDVLVVPSIWYENSPLVIKEAFATRTVVVASRCGGMAEYVRDGIDGLLFTPGDARDLRTKMRDLILNRDLLGRLRANAPPVKTIAEHAVELDGLFRTLASSSEQPCASCK